MMERNHGSETITGSGIWTIENASREDDSRPGVVGGESRHERNGGSAGANGGAPGVGHVSYHRGRTIQYREIDYDERASRPHHQAGARARCRPPSYAGGRAAVQGDADFDPLCGAAVGSRLGIRWKLRGVVARKIPARGHGARKRELDARVLPENSRI